MKARLARVAAAATLALTLGAGGATAARANDGIQPLSAAANSIGQTCIGSFGGTFWFTINVVDPVPAGATWTMQATGLGWPDWVTMGSTSDSTLVQDTNLSNRSVRFTAPVGIPAGTGVKVRPNAVHYSATGSTSVTLSGPGGSSTAVWSGSQGGPC